MKDKDKLMPALRAYKFDKITLDYAVDYILKVYSNSRRFNWNSFSLGILAGYVVMGIVHFYLKKHP